MDRSRLSSSNNYDVALKVIEQFNPNHVYFYAMGYEPWLSHILDIKHQDDSEQISDAGKWSLSVSAEISIRKFSMLKMNL